MENNKEFWQFSDQLRVHTSNLANLSLNDSIWCTSYGSKRPDDRRNFDVTVGGGINSPAPAVGLNPKINDQNGSGFNPKLNDYNGFNDGWKMGSNLGLGPIGPSKNVGVNDGFNKGVYSKHLNQNFNLKGHKNGGRNEDEYAGGKNGKKKSNNGNKNKDEESKNGVDKRFKTLPPSESLPRNETIGGYIFVCNNDTMLENLRRQLFGLPPRYRDSVRAITPGLPLFLYNYSTHQLHGIYEAASFGGSNIDPMAWEDKKCPGESRFPAQVKVVTRKICEPLEEDSFRPILHHYDGPKFRLELSVPEALSLLDKFVEDDMYIFTEISP